MATSGSVFSETLQEITNTKLDELSKRRAAFEEGRASILASIQLEEDAIKRLETLMDGVKKCFSIKLDKAGKVRVGVTKHERLEVELKNIDRFLDQAKCDPSVSAKMLTAWEQSLLRHLTMESLKFEYASLYGQLVTEWLSGDKEEEPTSGDDVEMGEAFEDVGNAKKLESRIKWEGMVFEPANVDEDELEGYLEDLFGVGDEKKKDINKALGTLRTAVESFEARISTPDQFNVTTLKQSIRGLLASDLLSNEKREVLRDFENNHVILYEIADVLNMRIGALDSWTWSSDAPVKVEMRRKISGIYNLHMHEDLLQAIFLQYIGVKWTVFFKRALTTFRDSDGVWKSTQKDISKATKLRLEYYLGPVKYSTSIQNSRNMIYKSKYFMAQLLRDEKQSFETADGDEEADYAQFAPNNRKRKAVNTESVAAHPQPRRYFATKMHRRVPVDSDFWLYDGDDDEEEEEDEVDDEARKPMALKQTLLHLLSTEVTINTQIYGELTAFHSVFESWDHLLPHETVASVLGFFGVSETWIQFFKKFLKAPMKFIDDDESTPAREQLRGTPTSHVLSDLLGETTLFCLDFAINQSTSGNVLWRTHDDIWFWSRDHSLAVKAWETVDEFTKITGTEINPAKTGTIRASNTPNSTLPIDKSLPEGEIRWGFLRFSPQTGRLEIDQVMVDSHIEELHKQVNDNKRKSIFAFIQAWNAYAATFFTSNFGQPANCFGRQHVDEMLATHERIQRQIFSMLSQGSGEKVSSVAEYLKNALRHRFGIDDVPDGYFYFPMELGGLELRSPFISLLQIRDEVLKSPTGLVGGFVGAERDAYQRAKTAFHDGTIEAERGSVDFPEWMPESRRDQETFISFDEYIRYREEFKFYFHPKETRLHNMYHQLMKRPAEKSVEQDDYPVSTAQCQLHGLLKPHGITSNWTNMEPYWRWVAMMYGPEIVDRFGGLNIVVPGSLPMGMVALFRDKRMKW